jgi:hypothetical protein
MNTLQFLKAILPEDGVKYLAIFKVGHRFPAHKAFTELSAMADAMEQLERSHPDWSIYHACASYKQEAIETGELNEFGKLKKKYRVEPNWNEAKAFWIDIDCGADKAASGKGYASQKDAAIAIDGFCETTGFPKPMLVSSGYGLHCYWPLTKPIPAEAWRAMAGVLKGALSHFGILADPTRTADFASVLRPVGSHNRKDVNNVKTVRTIRVIEPVRASDLRAILSNLVTTYGVKREVILTQAERDLNSDLTGHLAPSVPAFAEIAATKCKQLQIMRDTRGDVGYETWRGVIGVIKHCAEGLPLAVQWSENRAATGHDSLDVEARYNTWGSGPATCDFFERNNAAGCADCPFKGKITSPITLGREIEEPKMQVVEAVHEGVAVTQEVPPLPRSYEFTSTQMVKKIVNKDGVVESFPFAHLLFYPTHRIREEDDDYSLRINMHLPNKTVRTFSLPQSVAGAGGQKLVEALSAKELHCTTNKDASMHLSAYMKDSMQQLLNETEEIRTMTTFGWREDMSGFLIGTRLYQKDGSMRQVILGGGAADRSRMFPEPRGTTTDWSEGVNALYSRDGMEPMQYVLCHHFASILTVFGENTYKGIPVALTGSVSGKGKTTVCRAALSAFGNPDELTIGTAEGFTVKALFNRMSTQKNLPFLIDEITNIDPEELRKILYAASNGRERERLESRGGAVRLANSGEWSLHCSFTANKHLSAAIASTQANTAAEAVRMMEIQTDTYATPLLEGIEVGPIVKQIERNVGRVGEQFIQYVVQNQRAVMDLVVAKAKRIAEAGDIKNSDFRFYRDSSAMTLAAAQILSDLGFVAFDMDELTKWTMRHLTFLCGEIATMNKPSEEDSLNRLINDLAPSILVSDEYRDTSDPRGPEMTQKPQGSAAGRWIRSKGGELANKLFLSTAEFRKWCLTNRVPPDQLVQFMKSKGLMDGSQKRFTLGRGTSYPGMNITCYCIDMIKLEAMCPAPTQTLRLVKEEIAA